MAISKEENLPKNPLHNTGVSNKSADGNKKTFSIEAPSVSLPKGGGAIKGIDEKFSVNAVNGTSSFSIPVPVSSARGFAPSLSLSYNSGPYVTVNSTLRLVQNSIRVNTNLGSKNQYEHNNDNGLPSDDTLPVCGE